MPLVKSKTKEAFKSNIKAEVNAGRPVKQAVAIAYSVKNSARVKDPAPKKGASMKNIAKGFKPLT